MQAKKLTASVTVLVVVMSLGSAAFACGDGSCKGNNGWGNGADNINAGSDDGKTSVTKSVNGPANDKFSGR